MSSNTDTIGNIRNCPESLALRSGSIETLYLHFHIYITEYADSVNNEFIEKANV